MTVWLDCFRCHFQLWKWGLHHRDISPNNLMYYWTEQGRIVGVLNDFDLAVLASSAAQSSKERTGTLPYMANDLLQSRGRPIAHFYEYDAESFIYVLLWAASGYDEGNVTPATPYLREWQDDNPSVIIVAHNNALSLLESTTEENQEYSEYTATIVNLCAIILWGILSMNNRRHAEDIRHEPKADLTNTQYITEVNAQLEEGTKADKAVDGIAMRELDLPKQVAKMDIRGRNSRLMAEELQKQKPELASAV
ncbi:hypothetical protein BC629DRAFT_384474 [Irpex lacteus]|nr:hypothetical protein BC629DRAFT_384474 [Irpex lacteus]